MRNDVRTTIRLLALDIDGTLFTAGRVPPQTLDILNELHAKGVLIGIASGRQYSMMVETFHGNGSIAAGWPDVITPDERCIYFLRHGSYEGDADWNSWAEDGERRLYAAAVDFIGRHQTLIHAIDPDVTNNPEVDARRGFVEIYFRTPEAAAQATRELQALLQQEGSQLRIIRNRRLIALRMQGLGKGPVLQQIGKLLQIQPVQILAVGNAFNDWEMLNGQYGFQSAAPANAEPEIKAVVLANNGYVATNKESAGVAEIGELLLRNKLEWPIDKPVSGSGVA